MITTPEIISYAVAAISLLVAYVFHLRANAALQDAKISDLQSVANLAAAQANATSAEEVANASEKNYDTVRDNVLNGTPGTSESSK